MVNIWYEFSCDYCGRVAESKPLQLQAMYYAIPNPNLPSGWIVLDSVVICDNHTVKVEDLGFPI